MAPNIMSSFVTVLCTMHFYWLALFFKMIYKAIITGSTDDS